MRIAYERIEIMKWSIDITIFFVILIDYKKYRNIYTLFHNFNSFISKYHSFYWFYCINNQKLVTKSIMSCPCSTTLYGSQICFYESSSRSFSDFIFDHIYLFLYLFFSLFISQSLSPSLTFSLHLSSFLSLFLSVSLFDLPHPPSSTSTSISTSHF